MNTEAPAPAPAAAAPDAEARPAAGETAVSARSPQKSRPPREEILYLLKPGELVLKGGNRAGFESLLRRNLETMLRTAAPRSRITFHNGRYYVRVPAEAAGGGAEDGETAGRESRVEAAAPGVEKILAKLSGISGWAAARETEKTAEAVLGACVVEGKRAAKAGKTTFKIEARRADKSFPLSSREICRAAGDAVTEAVPELTVDVHNPGAVINVEIREKAYVYGDVTKGLRGLPVGSSGRGLLLLSGGIDSPVAGILMALRGMGLDAVYFHTPPYTPPEAADKTRALAAAVGSYAMGARLCVAVFTEVQRRIRERAPLHWSTVLLRMAMMEAASMLAGRLRSKCLVTGESLSQVASQTIENIACAESRAALPVLRPLAGMDKETITGLAKRFGTYETSILPYADCCALFSPPHPVLRGEPDEAGKLYAALDAGELIAQAVRSARTEKHGYYGESGRA